jgi:hypothetical protein
VRTTISRCIHTALCILLLAMIFALFPPSALFCKTKLPSYEEHGVYDHLGVRAIACTCKMLLL